MKKVMFFSSAVGLAMAMISGCGVYNTVSVTQANSVDFRHAFQTFAWMPDQADTLNTAYNNEIIRDNIRQAISRELTARHMNPADAASADLMLQLVVENRDRSREYGRFMPAFYFGPFGGSYNSSRTYYAHNRLTVNMFDQKTSHLVWTCTVEGDLSNAGELSKNIQPAVGKIMKRYPVAADKNPV